MTQQQIEDLKAGVETDAEIEHQFFGHTYYGYTPKTNIQIDEGEGKPLRDPRPFSRGAHEALMILDAAPGWRAWHGEEGICVQLGLRIRDTIATVQGIGIDKSFPLAVCKAALMLIYVLRDFKAKEKESKAL
jgi:hypothetical protein